jgi:uncharacterized membrane protein YeiH
MRGKPNMTGAGNRIVRVADLGGTLVFAIEGALAALVAGLDPVGVLVLDFSGRSAASAAVRCATWC